MNKTLGKILIIVILLLGITGFSSWGSNTNDSVFLLKDPRIYLETDTMDSTMNITILTAQIRMENTTLDKWYNVSFSSLKNQSRIDIMRSIDSQKVPPGIFLVSDPLPEIKVIRHYRYVTTYQHIVFANLTGRYEVNTSSIYDTAPYCDSDTRIEVIKWCEKEFG